MFDEVLNIFLPYVTEDDIDKCLLWWYRLADEHGFADNLDERSGYYDMLRPVLVKAGVIDDDTGDEL